MAHPAVARAAQLAPRRQQSTPWSLSETVGEPQAEARNRTMCGCQRSGGLESSALAGALANAPTFAAALAGTLATALDAATAAAADSTADHLSPVALAATSWRACRLDASAATARLASCLAGLFFLSFAVL